MNKTAQYAFLGAALGILTTFSASAEDGLKLSASIKEAIAAKPSELLAIVQKNVSANPGSACEVVKAAIEGSRANAEVVASIVETASSAAPDQMRLIAQCSLAVAPDAANKVQAVLAKLDPSAGGGDSAKEDGDYVWAKNVRLGKAVATRSSEHYKAYDSNGVYIGDLHARDGADARVRATATGGGSTWVYTARVAVPGTGWTQVEGGILAIRSAQDYDFYLQSSDDFNPLNFPGQGEVGPSPGSTGNSLLPPTPGAPLPPPALPPVISDSGFDDDDDGEGGEVGLPPTL